MGSAERILHGRRDVPDVPQAIHRAIQAGDSLGTAHECWFLVGITDPYPEDNHLALVWSNTQPALAAISVGTMIPTLTSGVYNITPENTGVVGFYDRENPDQPLIPAVFRMS